MWSIKFRSFLCCFISVWQSDLSPHFLWSDLLPGHSIHVINIIQTSLILRWDSPWRLCPGLHPWEAPPAATQVFVHATESECSPLPTQQIHMSPPSPHPTTTTTQASGAPTQQLFHQRYTQPPPTYSVAALSGQRLWTGGPSHPSLVDKALWLPGLLNTHTHARVGAQTHVNPVFLRCISLGVKRRQSGKGLCSFI